MPILCLTNEWIQIVDNEKQDLSGKYKSIRAFIKKLNGIFNGKIVFTENYQSLQITAVVSSDIVIHCSPYVYIMLQKFENAEYDEEKDTITMKTQTYEQYASTFHRFYNWKTLALRSLYLN